MLHDLQPVSMVGIAPLVLLTYKDVPATDYHSLVDLLKAHPDEYTTGSNGRGSAGHLAGALFKKMAGVDVRYIPYRTTPQAQADLIGGRVSMMWLSTLTDQIAAGTLRPIAVGEELTFFYPATEWHMEAPFPCACGAAQCLLEIRGTPLP